MNEIIVISGMTHKAGTVDEYESQLKAAGIPFEIEPYPSINNDPNNVTMSLKMDFLTRVVEKYSQFKTIYHTDAWDVLFFGTYDDLVRKAPDKILISAERNCYPEGHLNQRISGPDPWKYANAGTLAANREYLVKWLEDIKYMGDLGILDQRWYNRRLAEDRLDVVPLDYNTDLFYVVGQEDGSLKFKDGRPYNDRRKTCPNFLHFSGSERSADRIHNSLSMIERITC